MNVIVHFPTDEAKQQELQRRVAVAHGNAVVQYIKQLPCPEEQKKKILAQLIRER